MFHLLETRIADEFASRIQALYGIQAPVQTEQPKQSSFGEIAVPAAFQLARQLKKAPKAIAGELAANTPVRVIRNLTWERPLVVDGNGKDIQGSRVIEETGDLDFLHQILFSDQLLKDAVLRPYPEWRRRVEVAPAGIIDLAHFHYQLSLPVPELEESMLTGLALSHFLQGTAGTNYLALDLYCPSEFSAKGKASPGGYLSLCARREDSQRQGHGCAHAECFTESRHRRSPSGESRSSQKVWARHKKPSFSTVRLITTFLSSTIAGSKNG